mmetsp:Transcript_95316/g.199362  ORF Transcript_95316/g.199362 Transcript_95316/m.199362 type:complete len:351 (-) Transcript_95316:68-1120(-)
MGVLGKPDLRPWAVADDAPPRPDGKLGPTAPFAMDFESPKSVYLSSTKRTYQEGLTAASRQQMRKAKPAGLPLPPFPSTTAMAIHKSGWDAPDWKSLETKYMADNIEEPLARHHRRLIKHQTMSKDDREKRWIACFSQWSSTMKGAEHAAAAAPSVSRQSRQSHQTGGAETDFSMLPAGYFPVARRKPKLRPRPGIFGALGGQPPQQQQQQPPVSSQVSQPTIECIEEGPPPSSARAQSVPGRASRAGSLAGSAYTALSARGGAGGPRSDYLEMQAGRHIDEDEESYDLGAVADPVATGLNLSCSVRPPKHLSDRLAGPQRVHPKTYSPREAVLKEHKAAWKSLAPSTAR